MVSERVELIAGGGECRERFSQGMGSKLASRATTTAPRCWPGKSICRQAYRRPMGQKYYRGRAASAWTVCCRANGRHDRPFKHGNHRMAKRCLDARGRGADVGAGAGAEAAAVSLLSWMMTCVATAALETGVVARHCEGG